MDKREFFAVIFVLLATVGTVAGVFAYRNASEKGSIMLLAQSPEKGNWDPQTITVERGKQVDLTIRNIDTVSHAFYIPAIDFLVREIKAGEVAKVNFTIPDAGEYLFLCGVWCSDYHMQMRGKVIVQ